MCKFLTNEFNFLSSSVEAKQFIKSNLKEMLANLDQEIQNRGNCYKPNKAYDSIRIPQSNRTLAESKTTDNSVISIHLIEFFK